MPLELGAVPVPVGLGKVERRLVPALAAEIRIGLQARHVDVRHERQPEPIVLLPVPVGGQCSQAAKARLALAQRAVGPRLHRGEPHQALERRRTDVIL